MRHAFLITAYTDLDFLKKAIEVYSSDSRVDCYIHVDKKSKVSKDVKAQIENVCSGGGAGIFLFEIQSELGKLQTYIRSAFSDARGIKKRKLWLFSHFKR